MASSERRLISDEAKTDATASITTIMCIGTTGTSEGSRLKGQARRGRGKVIQGKAQAIRFDWHDQRILDFTDMLNVFQSHHPPTRTVNCVWDSGNQSRVAEYRFAEIRCVQHTRSEETVPIALFKLRMYCDC
jgi:hypothetical protein